MPENGAGVLGWMLSETPILRRALPEAVSGDPQALGMFPLLPYCNRIALARFPWAGHTHHLEKNFGDHPHAIHGVGWQRPWVVQDAADDSATLTLSNRPDFSWPFAFDAVIQYDLTPSVLRMTIGLTNRHDGPAPGGIGLHPYFSRSHDPSLQFNAEGAWRNGPDSLPCCHGAVPPDWQHAAPRQVARSKLDNCFTDWDRCATIRAGPASLRIEASDVFSEIQVFTPPWADFFCAEPVSHVPDAINRPDLARSQAMHVLLPGETLEGTIQFTLLGSEIDALR